MNAEKDFLDGKKIALKKLENASNEDKVDKDIQPLLEIINNFDEFYTTSSCYGRTALLELPNIGNKKDAKFLGKWHRTIDIDELLNSFKNAKKGQIWLLSQSPIIHIIAKSSDSAEKLLKTAISCGFKNSGIKSLGKKIVVEVCSTERLDVPIGDNGEIFCNNDHIKLLVDISNEIITKSTMKLTKLEKKLREIN